MILLNEMEKQDSPSLVSCRLFLKLLTPFAPHMSQELWNAMGNKTFLDFEEWPEYDSELIKEETFMLVVQINGKMRDVFEVPVATTEEEAEKLTLEREKVSKYLGSKKPRKIIYIPKRLINIVI